MLCGLVFVLLWRNNIAVSIENEIVGDARFRSTYSRNDADDFDFGSYITKRSVATEPEKRTPSTSSSGPERSNADNTNNDGDGAVCIHKFHSTRLGSKTSNDENVSYSEDDNSDQFEYEDDVDRVPKLSTTTLPGFGDVQIEQCTPHAEFCYAFWTEDTREGKIDILGQGCWKTSDKHDVCNNNECRASNTKSRAIADSQQQKFVNFCCCKSRFCNVHPISSSVFVNTAVPILDVSSMSPSSANNSILGFSSLSLIIGASLAGLVIIMIAFLIYKYSYKAKQISLDVEECGGNVESGGPGFSCSNTCVDNLKLHDNIGSGRHAKIWRGSLGGIPVAVKALPTTHSSLWARERDVYCLPHMKHPNLLQYFGCDTRPTLEGPPEHLLVLQLAPLGSLKSFLIDHTLDWDTYTNMALGIASALAHLHTHIDKDDLYKPCVAHRDVNSSNIVVRADFSCCLADLGLAMPLPDSKSNISQTQYRIQEAGTLRYLAPEALEGSLDLRRCAASLRAVDVYALSLVLWELLSRCDALHRAPGPPPYASPFQAEVGDSPTLERMEVVVARHKARPLFSPRLLSIRATHLARDTCEDCWDHDAEARLTAVCVVERLYELKSMRPAPSPTINSNDLRPPTQNQDSNWHSPGSCEDKISNLTSSAASNTMTPNLMDLQATILNKLPLQPHQGRNPCLERNLASVGQTDALIDKSLKDMPLIVSSPSNYYGSNNLIRNEQLMNEQNYQNVPQDFSRLDEQSSTSTVGFRNTNRQFSNQNSVLFQSNHYDSFANSPNPEDQLLNEFRQMTRPVTPIGYVQNDVSNDVNSSVVNLENNPYGFPAKRSNISQENKLRWGPKRLKKFFNSKVFRKRVVQNKSVPLETEVNLVLSNGKSINYGHSPSTNGKTKTSLIVNNPKNVTNVNMFTKNDVNAGRPSSLPGLDSVTSNETLLTECSVGETDQTSNQDIFSRKNKNHLENNTCTISPPNRTITCNMRNDSREGINNMIVGYKELPSFGNDVSVNDLKNGSKPSNQMFAVIVPRSHNSRECNSEDKNITLLSPVNILEHGSKVENKLVQSDDGKNTNREISGMECSSNKDYLSLYKNNLEFDNLNKAQSERITDSNKSIDQIPEIETDLNYASNNVEVDYSSNSEDEHMLLLSENGGSKITMRQRYDIKPSQENKIQKGNWNMASSISVQDNTTGLSKIAAGSFSSLCNKYNNVKTNKYENLKDDTFSQQQNTPIAKDAACFNHHSKILSLSICKQNSDEANFINLDDHNDSEKSDKNTQLDDNSDTYNIDNNLSDDDTTFPDDSSIKKNASSGFRPLSIKHNLSRQHSLELVSELFSSSADLTRLKDPASRIKTPGDVPPSVRRMRGSLGSSRIRRTGSTKESNTKASCNRLSLYDDRMMFGNSL